MSSSDSFATAPQCTDTVFMVRPSVFGLNPETAKTNHFQPQQAPSSKVLTPLALAEFEQAARALNAAGVKVIIANGRKKPASPDALFPNNWVSFHLDGTVVLYPMATRSRRLEKDARVITSLAKQHGFQISQTIDLSFFEKDELYLEGTGSMVLDREYKTMYACRSARTSERLLEVFSRKSGFEAVVFEARDRTGFPIYHTNVMLSVGYLFAMVCSEAIAKPDRRRVIASLEENCKTVIDISFDQMYAFAGNMLELRTRTGEPVIAMSQRAEQGLTPKQREQLQLFGKFVSVPLDTIETYGGGSMRCMLAEVFLPKLNKASQ